MATPKKKSAPSASKKPGTKKKSTKGAKPSAPAAPSLDWSATIKKAAQEKRSQASWPGTGDAWKKKARS